MAEYSFRRRGPLLMGRSRQRSSFKTGLKLFAETGRSAGVICRALRSTPPDCAVAVGPGSCRTDGNAGAGCRRQDDGSRPHPNHDKHTQYEHKHRDQAASHIPEVSVQWHFDRHEFISHDFGTPNPFPLRANRSPDIGPPWDPASRVDVLVCPSARWPETHTGNQQTISGGHISLHPL